MGNQDYLSLYKCLLYFQIVDTYIKIFCTQAFQKELENYLASIPEALSSAVGANGQTWVLEQKLHSINDRYRKLLRAIQFKSNLLNESLTKHQDYEEKVGKFTPWMEQALQKFASEFQEPIPSEAKKIQKRLDVIKVYCLKILLCIRN